MSGRVLLVRIHGAGEILHIEEVDGGCDGERLLPGCGAVVAGVDEFKLILLREIAVDAGRQHHVDVDVLHVPPGRRGAASVGAVHAAGGPEEGRELGLVQLA